MLFFSLFFSWFGLFSSAQPRSVAKVTPASGMWCCVTVTAVRWLAVIWPDLLSASAERGPDKGAPPEQMKVSADCLESKRKVPFFYISLKKNKTKQKAAPPSRSPPALSAQTATSKPPFCYSSGPVCGWRTERMMLLNGVMVPNILVSLAGLSCAQPHWLAS